VTKSRVEAFHLDGDHDRRFAVLWLPDPKCTLRGSVLFVPPWAEEANKSRRMVAQTASALAAEGWAVLRFDLYGTGDSTGDLADASWTQWINDLVHAFDWLLHRSGQVPVLWAMRAGALLVDAARSRLPGASRLLLWQPVTSGKTHLTQFLRLRVAADAIGGGSGSASTRLLLDQFRSGLTIEIAGYRVPPAVALGLHDAQWLGPWPTARVDWLEVVAADPPTASPTAAAAQDKMRGEGSMVHSYAIQGAPFWQTQELEDCPALVEATLVALNADGHSA
jgi:uncharacterized protein